MGDVTPELFKGLEVGVDGQAGPTFTFDFPAIILLDFHYSYD